MNVIIFKNYYQFLVLFVFLKISITEQWPYPHSGKEVVC
jgi:hypothetical protein